MSDRLEVEVLEIPLRYTPRAWQRAVHVGRKRFSVLALHRRAGKTKLAVMELIEKAASCTRPQGLFFYVAPELKQANAIAWRELLATLGPWIQAGYVEVRHGDLSVTFTHNGAMVRLYGADNPDAMRGVRLDGVVMDEVAQMKPEVWTEIVQPALADRLGWALFIGTPKGLNLFSELFFRATERMAENDPHWYAARYTVHDTEALDPAEVARLERDMGDENAWAREMLCDFTASGDDQLISLADVEQAATRGYTGREDFIRSAPVIIGCDPARFGDDRSVIVRRQGLAMFEPIILRNVDNMTLANRVIQESQRFAANAIFIDSGAGAGVIDRMRQLGHEVVEVPFGGKASDYTAYKDRRTEMWWEMRSWLLGGGSIPNILALKRELATPTYSYDNAGRRVLESKDDIKKRLDGAGSPDIADALAVTFAMPVMRPEDRPKVRRGRSAYDHDPYGDPGDHDPFA